MLLLVLLVYYVRLVSGMEGEEKEKLGEVLRES